MISDTNIIMYVLDEKIGFIQSIVEDIPNDKKNCLPGKLEISRIAIYNKTFDTSKNVFKFLREQTVLFDIHFEKRDTKTKIYRDCSITNYGTSYTADTITVSENITILYSDIIEEY